MADPKLPDINRLIQMGINPKTGLPIKLGNRRLDTKEDIKKAIRRNDRQIAANRYVWYNLPGDLSSQELEKNLYYYGQLCFWYMPELNKFFFSKYALDGQLDFYGRYTKIHPIPINCGGSDDKYVKAQEKVLSEIKLDVKYGVQLPEDLDVDALKNSAVIVRDFTNGIPQMDIPAATLHEPVMDLEAECMPFLRTALLNATGVQGVRVSDADQAASVADAARGMVDSATHAEPLIPIVGSIEFQQLTDGNTGKSQEFLQSMQAIDNFRLGLHGVPNGGLFDKQQYVNNAQTEMNLGGADVSLTMMDGLAIRQNFCNIVNSIWGLGIWCEPNETLINADLNGDGLMYNRNEEGQNSGMEDEDNE